jgi:hypothetical protein
VFDHRLHLSQWVLLNVSNVLQIDAMIHTLQPTLAGPFDRAVGNQSRRIVRAPHHTISGLGCEDTSAGHIGSCSAAVDADALLQIEVVHSGSDDTLCLSWSNRRVERLDVRIGEGSVGVV